MKYTDRTPPKTEPRYNRSPGGIRPNKNVKSRLYEGNTSYKNRLEESKRKIEEQKRKEISSPKRFVVGRRSPRNSPGKIPKTKQRPPVNHAKPVATTEKIKHVQRNKKVVNPNKRSNFKSPNAIRKAPLVPTQNKSKDLRNNVSASRAGVRRSRLERKATKEMIEENTKQKEVDSIHKKFI